MSASAPFLNPSEAAKRLGVSVKALRLYEARGLIAPARTAAGWRAYGPDEMARVAEIAALRELGLSLSEVARVLDSNSASLEPALAAHQTALESRVHRLAGTVDKVRRLRADLGGGRALAPSELARLLKPASSAGVAFDLAFNLPWPWGGERFELRDIRALNYIIGLLGSGKTRFAQRIADTLPGAAFLGLDRLSDGGAAAKAQLASDPALKSRVDRTLAWLVEDGATISEALVCLLAGLEAEGPAVLVIDMLEQGLDQPTQEALIARLRLRGSESRPLFFLTRSSSILDLDNVGNDEAIILCPANHSVPTTVRPYPGFPGFEAVATCLASPDVRARDRRRDRVAAASGLMKVAAYQAPLLPAGSMDALERIRDRIRWCETEGVAFLCCPEAVLGGLADDAQSPGGFAINAEDGELQSRLAPLASTSVTAIVGFTETSGAGKLHNAAAVFHDGRVVGIYRKRHLFYRKRHPAIGGSVYSAGDRSPVFAVGALSFGIMICNDSNYPELAAGMAARGAKVIFVPSNNGLPPEKADVVELTRSVDIARAKDNNVTIVRADVAGRTENRVSFGSSAIVDSSGTLLRTGEALTEDMLVAEVRL